MASFVRWGVLLSSALAPLAAGCTPPPSAGPGAAQTPPSPTGKPPAAPTNPSAPLDLLPSVGPSASAPDPHGQGHQYRSLYGRGQLEFRVFDPRARLPVCPLAPTEPPSPCAVYSLSTTGKSPEGADWFRGAALPAETRPSPWRRAPRLWSAFAGGRDAVYALSRQDKTLDRIDDQGNPAPLLTSEHLRDWKALWVFERGERLFFLGVTENDRLQIAEAAAEGAGRSLTAPVDLPIGVIPRGSENADAARAITGRLSAALYGEPRFVALPDDGAQKDRWAMAWVEVIAPPYRSPRGVAQTPSKAKNGCGGPHRASRPLSDPSVEKKVHIARFAGARLLDDKAATSITLGANEAIEARGDGGEITVQKAQRPGPFGWLAAADGGEQLAVSLSPVEHADAVAFDPASQEGLAVLRSDQQVFLRPFDAEGRPLLAPVTYRHPLPEGPLSLRRVGRVWMGLVGEHVVPLTDGFPPADGSFKGQRSLALFSQGDRPLLLLTHDSKLQLAPLDIEGRMAASPTSIAPLTPGMVVPDFTVVEPPDGPAFVVAHEVTYANNEPHHRLLRAPLQPDSSWSPLADLGPEPLPLELPIRYHNVHGGKVAHHKSRQGDHFIWLTTGRRLTLPPLTETSSVPPLLLPPQASEPHYSPALNALIGCSQVLPTAASTFVLVCPRAPEPTSPGIKVSLRRYKDSPLSPP